MRREHQPKPAAATNRLTTNYGYDLNGNMTNDGSNTLTYDGENRAITSSGTLGSGAYVYDGNNLRVKKCVPNCTSPTTTTVYVFSGSSVVAQYVNGAAPASPTREYIYSGSTLLAKIESGATQYYHSDHLSARLMTDSTGAKIGEQGHYPFGESWYATSTTTKWQFTTYERDAESGNDYARARFYVNRLGRFSALDPVSGSPGNPQSLDRYTYTRNDPIDLVDPMGLVASLTCGGGGDDMDGTGDANSGDSCSGAASGGSTATCANCTQEVCSSIGGSPNGCNNNKPPPSQPGTLNTTDSGVNAGDGPSCISVCGGTTVGPLEGRAAIPALPQTKRRPPVSQLNH